MAGTNDESRNEGRAEAFECALGVVSGSRWRVFEAEPEEKSNSAQWLYNKGRIDALNEIERIIKGKRDDWEIKVL